MRFLIVLSHKGNTRRSYADTFVLLEQVGHALDMENQKLYDRYKKEGLDDIAITKSIEDNLNIADILKKPAQIWDGGYVICGMTGSGDMFSFRDPHGIRPAFYYADDEIVVVALNVR